MAISEQSSTGIGRSRFTSYSSLDWLIWLMVSIWLVIDSITGFFISYGADMPLSQLFKFLALFLVTIRMFQYSNFLKVFFALLFYIAAYILHLALNNGPLAESLLLLSKFISLYFFFFYFRFSIRNFPYKTIYNAKRAMFLAFGVLAFNVALGVMGYGVPTYGEDEAGLGVKGFFYAGNELGGVMAAIVPFVVYYISMRLSGLKSALAYLAVMLIGVLIGTKTSILVVLLCVAIVPMLYMSLWRRIKVLSLACLIILPLYNGLANMISDSESVGRWMYFYDEGGMDRLVYSGRDDFWESKKKDFYESGFFSRLLGIGSEGKSVERDHLDTLVVFGYLGFAFVISFFLYLLAIAIRNRRSNSLVRVVIFSDLLVLGIGYMAGHVWFSAMSSIYIALLNSLSFFSYSGVLYGKPPKDSLVKPLSF